MSTGLLIVLIVVAVVAIALLVVSGRAAKARRDDTRRVEAGEHREHAKVSEASAERREAGAQEQAILAGQERREAQDRHEHADRLDPDVDPDGPRDADTGSEQEPAGEQPRA